MQRHFLQQWYGLADEALEDALYDSQALRGFAGRVIYIVKGTIARSYNEKEDVTPPYGHMNIVMDLTTCGTGSPMPVDRVPERYIGFTSS